MSALPLGLPGVGVEGLDPTTEELNSITTLQLALQWPGITDALRDGLFAVLGTPTVIRDIAFVGVADWQSALDSVQLTVGAGDAAVVRALNGIERGKLVSLRRVARLRVGLTPGDPDPVAAPPPTQTISQHSIGSHGSTQQDQAGGAGRNLKLSHLVDTTLDSTLVSLPSSTVRKLFEKYEIREGAKPSRAIEPTVDQLSAIQQLVDSDVAPYVDFSLFGPYGRRMLEHLTYFAFVSNPDGSWIRRELAGPNAYSIWYTSWRVLRTAFILLDLADPAHLDNYSDHIRALDTRYGRECWFIVYTGDKRMRSEQFERIRRDIESEHSRDPIGRPVDTKRPWNEVLRRAVLDREFWEDTVKEPAMLFLNRTTTAAAAIDDETVQPDLQRMPRTETPRVHVQDSSGTGPGAPAPKRQKNGKQHHAQTGDLSRKDDRGKYTHNRNGQPLCTAYQANTCGSRHNCPAGTHQCNICLSSHPGNFGCQNQDKGGNRGKGGGKGGGGKGGGRGGGKGGKPARNGR